MSLPKSDVLCGRRRHHGFNLCPAPNAAGDLEATADLLGALLHAHQTVMTFGLGHHAFRIEAMAIVEDAEDHGFVVVLELDAHLLRLRVSDRIQDGLLAYPQKLFFD